MKGHIEVIYETHREKNNHDIYREHYFSENGFLWLRDGGRN